MIKLLKYKDIDFYKYSKCLENSCQNSDFAEKKMLDIVSNFCWFLLVLNDYEAVMPVTYDRKFGCKFVIMRKFCFQLGVFSKEDNPKINTLFYDFLSQNFLVASYSFNTENKFEIETEQKISYILKKNNYQEIRKKYSKNRRRNVKITDELRSEIAFHEKITPEVESFFFNNIKWTKDKNDTNNLLKILKHLNHQNIGKLQIIEFKKSIQSLVYLFVGKRNVYLSLFVNNLQNKNSNFPSIMIDHFLKNFIEEKNFDFLGSEIKNIADFNKRFGAVSYKYSIIKNSKITLCKKLLTSYKIISNFAS